MPIVTSNARAYGDVNQRVMTAVVGTALPSTPYPTAWPSGWFDLGWLDNDAGLTEDSTLQQTIKYGWQGASTVRILRSQLQKSFVFNALEENAVTLGLLRPATTQATTGATAEVQTVTIPAGPPTGGTFTLSSIYGTYQAAWNVTTAALATALNSTFGFPAGTLTVTGTVSTSYVITFPASLGNVALMSISSALTGGGNPIASIATTTPGVNGTTTWAVKPFTGLNTRLFGLDLIDGTVHRRLILGNAEAAGTGSPVYKADDLTMYQFTLAAYPDSSGTWYTEISDNPAIGSGLFV